MKTSNRSSDLTRANQSAPNQVLGNSAMLGIFDLYPVLQRMIIEHVADQAPDFPHLIEEIIQQAVVEVQEKMPHANIFADMLKACLAEKIRTFGIEKEISAEQFKGAVVCLLGRFECRLVEIAEAAIAKLPPDKQMGAKERYDITFVRGVGKEIGALNKEALESSIDYVTSVDQIIQEVEQRENMTKSQVLSLIRDDRFSGNSPFVMEDEPGYTLAMLSGLKHTLDAPGEAMDAGSYEALHNTTVAGVHGLNPESAGYRSLADEDDEVCFVPSDTHVSGEGAAEWTGKEELARQNSYKFNPDVQGPESYLGFLAGTYTSRGTSLMYGAEDIISIGTKMAVEFMNEFLQRTSSAKTVGDKRTVFKDMHKKRLSTFANDPSKVKAYGYALDIITPNIGKVLKKQPPDPIHQSEPEKTGGELADSVFANYYQRLSNCDTAEKKIRLIAEVCQTLEQLHLFRDANLRTVCLLMNKLLRDNDLLTTAFFDPNVFDGYSVNELSRLIQDGQQKMQPAAQPGGSPDSGVE